MSIRRWEQLDKRLLQRAKVFDIYSKRLRSPDGSYEGDFFYLDAPDWANVIAITDDMQVVLVRQYRHGIDAACLEVPGGIIGDSAEDPQVAAMRELLEETGFYSAKVRSLGSIHPNPAIQSNRCHYFLATEAKLVSEQQLDLAEDIAVELVPLQEIPQRIQNGEMSHALTVVAFFRLFCLPEYARFFQQGSL